MQASLLESRAAVAACQKQQIALLEPPADIAAAPLDFSAGARKPDNSASSLQKLIAQVQFCIYRLERVSKFTNF